MNACSHLTCYSIIVLILFQNVCFVSSYRVEELETMKINKNYKSSPEGNNNCFLMTKYSDPDMKNWLDVFSKVAVKHKDSLNGTILSARKGC